MRLHPLRDLRDVGLIAGLTGRDGHIGEHRLAQESGLSTTVAHEHAGLGTQGGLARASIKQARFHYVGAALRHLRDMTTLSPTKKLV